MLNGVKQEWRSECGSIVLYQGDCLEIMPQMEPESVNMILTDPPFGHGNGDGDFLSRREDIMRDGRDGGQEPIANDDMHGMRTIVDSMLEAAVPLLKRDCCCCCCCCCGGGGGPSPTFAWLAERMDRKGLKFFHSVIWDKKNPGIGWRYRRQHEMLMVAHRTGGKLAWANDERKQPNIISMSKPRDDNHPNEKPLGLMLLFVANHTHEGDLVVDPCMGSGTTGVACVRAGRRFVGIELDEQHFSKAVTRMQDALAKCGLAKADSRGQRSLFCEEVA